MSHLMIYKIISTAITDAEFCDDLINGRRPVLLSQFDLTDEEHDFLMDIKANSLQEFCEQLGTWLKTQENSSTPLAMWQQHKWFDASFYIWCQGNSEGG